MLSPIPTRGAGDRAPRAPALVSQLYPLWNKHGTKPISAVFLDNFDDSQQAGYGIAGAPGTVRDWLKAQIAEAGVNYLVCRFAFGDMTPAESHASLELFARNVMPELSAVGMA